MTSLTFFNNSLVPYSNRLAEVSMRDSLGKSTIIETGNDVFSRDMVPLLILSK